MYVALYEWRNGKKSRVKFEGNTFIAIYRHHATTLQQMKEDSPIGYHEIMAELFSRVVFVFLTYILFPPLTNLLPQGYHRH